MLKCEQNGHSFPTYNHIKMDKNPTLVINCSHFIYRIFFKTSSPPSKKGFGAQTRNDKNKPKNAHVVIIAYPYKLVKTMNYNTIYVFNL